MKSLEKINSCLYKALEDLRSNLHEDGYKYAVENVDAGEPDLALELICDQLYEKGTKISRDVYQLLVFAGEGLGLPDETWKVLMPQIKVLPAFEWVILRAW